MSNICSIDRAFGQFGTLWSEMPAPEQTPQFMGGYPNAVWNVGPSGRPGLVVTSWDPRSPPGQNFRVLRLVLFPSDGHPDGLGRSVGTYHSFLSAWTVHCEYLDSDDNASNSFLVVVRERTGPTPYWSYILRRVNIVDSNPASVTKDDFPLQVGWFHEPSDVPPMGNLKIQRDGANPTRAALVSAKGGSVVVALLTIGQTVTATTTVFSSLITGPINPFIRLRVESVSFYGGDLSVALTGWRSSGSTQGLVFRLKVTGAAVARSTTYGTDGLWQSSLGYPDFRAVRECSNALVGMAGHKLVVMGVQPDGLDLDPSFGVAGIGEFDLGGTLLEPAIAGQDRNGWIHFFAQRQSDLATVGARVRVGSPLLQVPSGTLDPAFGTNGLVTLKVDGYSTAPGGLALHDDTVLDVALIRAINAADTIRVPGMTRMRLLDGSLDAAFGSAGVARHGGSSSASAFRSDGSRVYAMTRASDNLTTVVWLDAAGKFERAVSFPPPVNPVPDLVRPYILARSLQIHPDGSIWVSGVGSSAWVVRLTAAGSVDQTFGVSGVIKLRETDGSYGIADLIGWRANGGAIVKVSTPLGIFLCALSSSGQFDQSWGQAGYTPLKVQTSGYLTRADGSVLFPTRDGPVVFFPHFGLSRVTATGAIDPNFGLGTSPATAATSQFITLNLPYPGSSISVADFTIAAIVERVGKLYAIGTAICRRAPIAGLPDPPSYNFILITRWNQDGTVDTTYGNAGALFYGEDNGYLDWSCAAVAAEPGQPITLAGSAKGRPAIWQVTDSGILDTGFGPGGLCSVLLQEVPTDEAFAIAMLPGGKARLGCSTGLVQFAITSLPSKSIPQKILEGILKLLATLVSAFSMHLSERLRKLVSRV